MSGSLLTDPLKVAKQLNDHRNTVISTAVKHLEKMQKIASDLEAERAAYADAYQAALKAWAKAELDQMSLPAPDKAIRAITATTPAKTAGSAKTTVKDRTAPPA